VSCAVETGVLAEMFCGYPMFAAILVGGVWSSFGCEELILHGLIEDGLDECFLYDCVSVGVLGTTSLHSAQI